MTNYDYFLFFLRHKIDSGVKQVDLHRSDKISISTAYINKLYRRPPKNCARKVQEEIANYFNLTYDEMIEEAKKLYKEKDKETAELRELHREDGAISKLEFYRNADHERRSRNPINLRNQLNFVSESILINHEYTETVENQRDCLITLLNSLKTGVCVVDDQLRIAFQNPVHTKIFGNKINQRYSFFWDDSLQKEELLGKLRAGKYDTLEIDYNGECYRIEISANYKGNRVEQIIEHVIPQHGKKLLDAKMHIYSQVFKKLDHGFGFFNTKRELEIASNKFGLLDRYDFPNERVTVDQLLIDIVQDSENTPETISTLKRAYDTKEEINVNLKINGTLYNLQSENIIEDDTLLGVLLIVRKIPEQ